MVILFNHRVSVLALFRLLLEGAVLFIAFVLVALMHNADLHHQNTGLATAALTFAAVMVGAISAFGLYRHEANYSPTVGIIRTGFAVTIGFTVAYLAFFPLPWSQIYQGILPHALLPAVACLLLTRGALASGIGLDVFAHRVVVLGTGADALAVERALSLAKPDVRLVGFYPLSLSDSVVVPRHQVLSATVPLDEIIKSQRIKELIVAVREQRGGSLPVSQLLACRLQGIRVTDLSGFFERVTGEVPVNCLKASWLIYGEGFRQGWGRRTVKRCFDVLAALLLLGLSSPIMVATAIAIFVEGGCPIIFRQERVGHGGRVFRLIKFRSMRIDAEKDGTPRWASSNDSRVTTVGRWIRRTRIDELPQIFNVLKGEMSFVGPRPERPYFVAQLTDKIPFYGARHSVKPGLTGWAQVRYTYGASVEDAEKKLQYDLYYVKNHTLLLDFLVLLRTIHVVLHARGSR